MNIEDTISLLKGFPEYLFWKNKDSVYLGCNENYARILGFTSPEEIVGKTDDDLHWAPEGDSSDCFRRRDRMTMRG